jgi:predicted ATPase/class 3 adenylate cyclase
MVVNGGRQSARVVLSEQALMAELPTGTITFLFTDVEGSTRLLHDHGERYAALLAEHRRVLREVFARHEGVEVDTEGDAFFVAFASARKALAAAREAQDALDNGPLRVRMGLHTGEAQASDEGYVGLDVHRAARIAAAGHGGQVLVSASTSTLVDVELRDLGAHRLKDLSAPERLYQLGDLSFPPLKTLSNTNLPIPATSFLGRESELHEVTELLRRDDVRVLTLTGPGGTGKTRLALQAAGELADDYPDGVFWVPLAPLRDPALVLAQVAQALGAKLELRAYIGSRRLLLLLDNLEHLLAAAEEVGELVASCPRLGLLVTSRAPLHLEGEWEYAVDPLAENEAVALFEQRARAATRAFSANGEVAEICRRLDYLPLAIELAAARAKLLSAHAILARLEQRLPLLAAGSRNAPERQRTLRATIEWSNDLLNEEEQRLFAQLAVFAGGWELEAAEEICDADLEILGSLVDQSLVRRSGERFWMLETIREYAVERLEESGEADNLRARHADWYLELAERARPEIHRAQALQWLDRLEAEHANLRLAIDRALEDGDAARALRLTGAVWVYWLTRGHWTEGRRSLEAALDLASDRDLESGEDALWGAALLALWQDDEERGLAHATNLFDSSRARGSRRGEAIALELIAIAASQRGDFDRARVLFDESLVIAREVRDEWLITVVLNNLGDAELNAGNFERAIELFEESLALGEKRGDLDRRARQLTNLGSASLALGNNSAARARFDDALEAARVIGLREIYVYALLGLASVWVPDNPSRAARLQGVSDALAEQLGTSAQAFEARVREDTLAKLRAASLEDAYLGAVAHGRALSPNEAVAYALGHVDHPDGGSV